MSRRPDFSGVIEVMPETERCPELDCAGDSGVIRALFYRGIDVEGRRTRVFAYVGVPEHASPERPVPAVVLVHGGGGTAFAVWVRRWVERGYAAIAMDTNGNLPASPGSEDFVRDLDEAAGLSGDPFFSGIELPVEAQWMYAAISSVILAHSLLRADPRIDPGRIGLTGISWGGLIASLATCHDPRFAYSIPVYGCGYLHESCGEFSTRITPGAVAELWDPSGGLDGVSTPMLWLNSDIDPFFSADASSRSAAASGGALTLLPDFGHGHHEGWSPAEIYRFADQQARGGHGLIQVTDEEHRTAEQRLVMQLSVPEDMGVAEACIRWLEEEPVYAKDSDGAWRLTSPWHTRALSVDPAARVVEADMPPTARWYYINVIGTDGDERYTTSSRLYRREE